MALSGVILKHLNDNLDQSMGGGLRVESESARPADIPVLIIGLGGTGVNSVLRVKRMVEERLNVRDARDVMGNIEYLVFDTDSNSKNAEYKGTRFTESDTVILEHTRLAELYDGLKSNANADRNSSNRHVVPWISPHLDVRRITDGAGGVRQAGRFLMFSTFEKIETALRRKIGNIVKGKKAEHTKVYVFICSGISGGTGSGTFIDMPYIVRQVLAENGSWEARLTGFLFLPDVNLQDVKSDPSTADGIRKNGFAALKELDYLMNMDRSGNGDRFVQSYTENFEVNYAIPPYDICNLVSSIDKDGGQTTKRDFCMLSVAEAIVNFIADERNPVASEGADFSIASYWANITGTEARARDRLGSSKLPVVYKYCAVGASSGVLPLGKVLDSVAYKFFGKMEDLFNAQAGRADVSTLVESIDLTAAGIQTAIKKEVTGLTRPVGEFAIVKSNPTQFVENNLSTQLSRIKAAMEKNRDEYIKSISESLAKTFVNCFKDKDKGPYYVKDLLENTTYSSLQNYLSGKFGDTKGLAEQFIEKKTSSAVYNNMLATLRHRKETLISYSVPFDFGARYVLDKYIDAAFTYFSAQYNDAVWDYATEICNRIKEFISHEYADTYNVYAEVLSAVKEIFANNFKKGENDDNKSDFYWDLFSRDEFVEKIDELISDGTIKIDMDSAVAEFLKSLVGEKRDIWLGKTKKGLRIAQDMNEFICSQFRVLSDASVGKYMNYMLKESQFEEKAAEIKRTLSDNSQVMFPFKATIPRSEAQVRYISAPVNVTDNPALAEQFKIGETGQDVTVKSSVLTAQFFQFTVNPGIPLIAYRELEAYERVYERLFLSSDGNGLHLYEGGINKDNIDWKVFLPSPLIEQGWSNKYINERTKARNREIAALFDKAEKYGYIYENGGRYVWRTAQPVDINKLLRAENDITLPDIIENTDKVTAVAAVRLLREALSEASRYEPPGDFFDTLTENSKPDRRYAVGTLAAAPLVVEKLKKVISEHESVLDVISKLNKSINRDEGYAVFAMALAFGIITKERRTYKYTVSDLPGSAAVFARLGSTDEQLDYPEFYVYSAYVNLDDDVKDKIKERADDYFDDTSKNVREQLEAWCEKFTEKVNNIAANKIKIIDAAAMERFYSRSIESLEKLLKEL